MMSKITEIMSKASAGEYGEDSAIIGQMAGLCNVALYDKVWATPFICGTMGPEPDDGLHDGYMICPAYGVDANCIRMYKKV
jgi:hypothetical protein